MVNAPGHEMDKIFNKMLGECFPTSEHHVKDSYHLKSMIDKLTINENDQLVFFDVVAMYTNIPRSIIKDGNGKHFTQNSELEKEFYSV